MNKIEFNPEILIIEDQYGPLESIKKTISQVFPKYYENFPTGEHDIVRCYNDAKKEINEKRHDFIFLDHMLPREDLSKMEKTNFDGFVKNIEEIGYGLIPLIREKDPYVKIIGTSSKPPNGLKGKDAPDYNIKKISYYRNEAISVLESMLEKEREIQEVLEMCREGWNRNSP